MYENNGVNRDPEYGQNPYIDFFYMQNYERKKQEKRQLRKLGLLTGAAVLLFIVLENAIVVGMMLFGVYDKYMSDPLFQTGMDMLISVAGLLVPFAIFGHLMRKEVGIENSIPFGKPEDKKLSLLAIPAGLGICMAANIVSSYIVLFMQGFGYQLSSPDIPSPGGAYGFFVSVVRTAVVAGFVEEMSLRGYVLQPLRKYGDTFAIAMSACAFGLMHGNLIQAPFALIVGIGLGYICIKTGSLWLPIMIHALNNFISTAVGYIMDHTAISDEAISMLYSAVVYGLMIIGIPCLVAFVIRARRVLPENRGTSVLSAGEKTFAYVVNPTMIIAIILMLYFTSKYIARI